MLLEVIRKQSHRGVQEGSQWHAPGTDTGAEADRHSKGGGGVG